MLSTNSIQKTNVFIDTIFQASINESKLILLALQKIIDLDIGYHTEKTSFIYSAATLLAANNKNKEILFLANISRSYINILAQSLAYYLTNGLFKMANDLIKLIVKNYNSSCYSIFFQAMFNFINSNISICEISYLKDFFTVTELLSPENKKIFLAKVLALEFLKYGESELINSGGELAPEYQDKCLFYNIVSFVNSENYLLTHQVIDCLERSNFIASFTANVSIWRWNWLIDSGYSFGQVRNFLSANLMDRVLQYKYALAKYLETSNFTNYQYTLSCIDLHEGEQSSLIKSFLYSEDIDLSSIRPKSLDQLRFRNQTYSNDITF